MMRIEPDRDTLPALRPTANSAASDTGFASALGSARNSVDPSLPVETDPSNAGTTPLAERWGAYGRGATAEGYGTPPDAAQYSALPVGPDQPASPLNPGGVTTRPAFTVDGYTARGTPVPPGFYNLAYYNWYLRDGGTPLAGFSQLADGATISETYGTFGDGIERATSFVTAPTAGGDDPGCASAAAGTAVADPATATTGVEGVAAPSTPATSVATASARTGGAASTPSSSATAATSAPKAAAASDARSRTTIADAPATTPATNDLAAAVRIDLTTLLSDLLREV
ncbi:MAG: hypothetical protein HY271_10795 [Deltaproteobacteria bacterium]|nr:hypothetical protein [Deltaproteobacteria bacterium]